jgi:hypothetical protein
VALIVVATTATTAAFTATTAATGASTTTTAAEAASSATTAAKTSTTAATAAAGAVRLWLGLIDLQRTSLEFGSVKGCDRLFGLAGVGHFYERKAARAAGFAVGNQADFFNRSVGLEQAA